MNVNGVPKRAFINVDYDEFNVKTYRGIEITIMKNLDKNDDEKKVFFTGNFDQDLDDAINWATNLNCEHILCSSSVDHFYMDRNV